MNLLLGDNNSPTIQGTLALDAPVLQGILEGPSIFGSLVGDSKHDLVLVDGNVSPTAGLDQRIDCALRLFLSEHWLNPERGMRYFEEFLKKNPDPNVCKQAFASVIWSVPGVQQITSLQVTFAASSRSMRVDFAVTGTDSMSYSNSTEVLV